MTIPHEAVVAADGTLLAFLEPWLDAECAGTTLRSQIRPAAAIALRDAAPLIAAAERARIRQLAILRGDELADHARQGQALPTMSAMLAAKAAALSEFADLLGSRDAGVA